MLSNWLQTFQLSITLPTPVGPEFQQSVIDIAFNVIKMAGYN